MAGLSDEDLAVLCELADVTRTQLLALVKAMNEQLKSVGSDKGEYGAVGKVGQHMAKVLCADGLLPPDNSFLMSLAIMHSTQRKITSIQRGYQTTGEKITQQLQQWVEDDYSTLTKAAEKMRVAREDKEKAKTCNDAEPNEENGEKWKEAEETAKKALNRVEDLLNRLVSARSKQAALIQKYLKLQRDFHLNIIKVIDAAIEDCANLERLKSDISRRPPPPSPVTK